MRTSFRIALAWLAMSALQAAAHAAGSAHVHGVARLDVAVDAGRITLQFESPLDNLLGFERAPRTDAERRQTDAVLAQLRAAGSLFRIDPAAQCTPGRVELTSAALKLGQPAPAEAGHADIDASVEFSCAAADKAAYIDVGLFGFARLQRVAVQVAMPQGQFKRELVRPVARILLSK